MSTRRDLGQRMLAALAGPRYGRPAEIVSGVRLGVHTRSFRELPRKAGTDEVDTIIQAMAECGVHECELFAPQVEARFGGDHGAAHHGTMSAMSPQMMRRELRKWRLRTPLDHFRAIGHRFKKAGITVYAYNYSPNPSFTDEEIDRGFGMAKALGAEIITASTTLDMAKRIAPFAEHHQMAVAMHGEIGTPAGFAAVTAMSKFFKVHLDVGHFTAGHFDAVEYIRQHHAEITNLLLSDRRKNQGDDLPWGRDDAPIREVLLLLKREAWPIRAYVEHEYPGARDPIEEVKKCIAYAKQVLL